MYGLCVSLKALFVCWAALWLFGSHTLPTSPLPSPPSAPLLRRMLICWLRRGPSPPTQEGRGGGLPLQCSPFVRSYQLPLFPVQPWEPQVSTHFYCKLRLFHLLSVCAAHHEPPANVSPQEKMSAVVDVRCCLSFL